MCQTNIAGVSASNMNNSSSSLSSNNNEDKSEATNNKRDVDNEHAQRDDRILKFSPNDDLTSDTNEWWAESLIDFEAVGINSATFRIIDFNELQIGDTIGVGGFGHVFYGKYAGVDVAIKTAKSLALFCSISSTNGKENASSSIQKTLIDGLLREACLFSNLKHKNIIQLFGVSPCLSTKSLYLVMEYAQGGALSFLLQQRQSGLYPNVFIRYAKQIADGMKYLHEDACEHIIHRDLKCSNILILESIHNVHNDADLLNKTLKITDFGLARKQIQSTTISTAGTFAWMSPECIRNNEFSIKSDVWSFGVLLWECLTGELPYKGFDPMQVVFGIATNKYCLPIPSTCPKEFAQLMTNCWKISPNERPTFSALLEQINEIIDTNYKSESINYIEQNEDSYQSLQNDWRQEIQDMFNELKEKEKEIRDLEEEMRKRSIEQNYQRLELERWEKQLQEREMHIVELQLKLLIAANNQERPQHHTPKVPKRSGRLIRSLLNGSLTHSSNAPTSISSPTNFRHLISIAHNNHPTVDTNLSPTSVTSSSSPISSSQPYNRSYSSNSTPTTPNMNRLRTLTSAGDFIINKYNNDDYLLKNAVYYPVDESNQALPPKKPPRSKSQTKTFGRKSKSSSYSAIKRKLDRSNVYNSEAKWYLDNVPSINTNNNNNNNNNDNLTLSSTISTPSIEHSTRKLGSDSTDESNSSSSSLCSTPNDRSLARTLFDINTMLTSIAIGRPIPAQIDPSQIITCHNQSTSDYSTNQSPIEQTSPLENAQNHSSDCQSEASCSPVRPNSLTFYSQNSSQNNSTIKTLNYREQINDDDSDKYYSAQSSKISTPMINTKGFISFTRNSEEKLILPPLTNNNNEESNKTRKDSRSENKHFHLKHNLKEKNSYAN